MTFARSHDVLFSVLLSNSVQARKALGVVAANAQARKVFTAFLDPGGLNPKLLWLFPS